MIHTFLLLFVLAQSPSGSNTPAPTGGAPTPNATTTPTNTTPATAPAPTTAPLKVETSGGIQAPTQPTNLSTSTLTKTSRFAPTGLTRPDGDFTTPISSLAAVRGQEDNPIVGIGIVTGLAGTGDSTDAGKRLLANFLRTRNIHLDPGKLSSKNVALVQVDAVLPAGIKVGRRIDVQVSAIGDSSSLVGGTLLFTELTDVTGQVVYATASGPITVGGFTAEGQSGSAKKNHTTVGNLPNGGKVEREVPTTLVSEHGYIYLDMKTGHDSLANCVRITEAVNDLYPGSAHATPDGKSIAVAVPRDLPEAMHPAFLQSMLEREIVSKNLARVIISERTGTIVMGGDVRLRAGAIAQGAITVTIAESPTTSQPGPLSNGQTQTNPRTALDVKEDNNGLVLVPGAVTLQEVVDVLNVLGTTPRDLIVILEAMAQGGLLEAEIRRM